MKTTPFLKALLFSVSITAFISCSKDNNISPANSSVSNQPLTGKINGKNVTMTGYAFENSGKSDLNITFSDTVLNGPCAYYIGDGKDIVTFSVAAKAGTYALGSSTVSFLIGKTKSYLIATSGTIEISSIDTTANNVNGKMNVKYNDNNYLNGNFSVKICK